ncbi:hypothetical protein H2201_000854 [Coniosporium apollinis]|uniref:Steroid 5-alpha reductase C-terminal domain-containing protein n=1 Tax=Coniosporium apollinis TaxID=61459 RepID=A0ABQ9P425_9PEZI|nr:hypothetical protein H2201_000854 [Coniosporium apollinis]
MVWVWTVSLPVTILNSPKATEDDYETPFGTGQDITGVVLYIVGLIMETVSDAQKYRFMRAHGNDDAIYDRGFFAWSRHPNYFGEMVIHFGIWVITLSPAFLGDVNTGAMNAIVASVVGPRFLTFLLMFVCGLPLQERPGAKKRYENGSRSSWEAYARYLNRTSILIPVPPQLYARTPAWIKRTLFLEYPMYVFDPAKHSDRSKRQSSAEEGLGDRQAG